MISFIRKITMSITILITALTGMIVTSQSSSSATPVQQPTVQEVATSQVVLAAARPRVRSRAYWARARARGYAIRRAKIVRYAMRQRGKRYVFGAVGPRAYDCSGLTMRSARAGKVRIPRIADAQYRRAKKVSKRRARAGDMVFWVNGGGAYHVGVYAGRGRVIHAPQPGDSVKVSGLWGSPRFGKFLP